MSESFKTQQADFSEKVRLNMKNERVMKVLKKQGEELFRKQKESTSYFQQYIKEDIPALETKQLFMTRDIQDIELDKRIQLMRKQRDVLELQLTRRNRNALIVSGDLTANTGNALNLSQSNYFLD